ncbi:MAG: histidinol-phosphate transaminase [Patescibacteria group bacterium]
MQPNEFIKRLKEYPLASHAAWEAPNPHEVLKMDWNEPDLMLPAQVKRAVIDFVENGPTQWYPDIANKALLQGLARYAGVPVDHVQYFAGEDSALDYAVRAFVTPGDTVGLVAPTYDNFRVFVESVGAEPVFIALDDPFSADIEALIERIPRDAKLVYLVNPNNPTGVLYSVEEVERLLTAFPETLFFVDEAYIEFGGATCVPLATRYPNIIVGRSTSKSFGLASFRLGYLIASPENLVHINKIRNGKNVSALAQVAAVAALRDTSYVHEYVKSVQESRLMMQEGLTRLGYAPIMTPANFILLPVSDPKALTSALTNERVFIRTLGHLAGMEQYVRITVGTPENTRRFLAIVEDLLSHGKISLS